MKYVHLLLIFVLLPLLARGEWSDADYKRIEQNIRQPEFADREFYITKYGADVTASASDNQKAFNNAIKACNESGGGKVIVPSGTFHTGAIELLSHVNLVLEKGATIQFAYEPDLYPIVATRWEGVDCWNISPCVYAYKATDVAITGEGVIDGGGSTETWWKWCGYPHLGWKEGDITQFTGRPRLLQMAEDCVDMDQRRFSANDGLRPQLINFNQCDGVLMENITVLRPAFWAIHPLLSKNVIVRGIHINNDAPNGDGCDPESCNGVLIENCFFNTGDDCIAIKGGRNNDGRRWNLPTQNIIIRNCEMQNGHGGITMGSEITGGCRDLYAENCKMDSPNLNRVVRIKSNTCRGGKIENINIRNITVGQCRESVLEIDLNYDPKEVCTRGFLPIVRDVNLENIKCEKSQYGVNIGALDESINVYDIDIVDCRFNNVADGNCITGLTQNINFKNCYINGELIKP